MWHKVEEKKIKTKTKKKCSFHTSCPPSPIAFCPGLCFYRDFGCASCRTGPYCDLSCGFWLDALGSWPRILSCRRPPATDFCLFFPVKNLTSIKITMTGEFYQREAKKAIKVYPGNMYFNELFHWQTTTVNECIYIKANENETMPIISWLTSNLLNYL